MSWQEDYCCEYCNPSPQEIIIRAFEERLRRITQWFNERICERRGHVYVDKEPLSFKVHDRKAIIQRCTRCSVPRYLYADTREVIENYSNLYGIAIYHALNKESNLYSLFPKTTLSSESL